MAGFNPNKFIKDSSECADHSVNVVPVAKTTKRKKKTKNEGEETATPMVVDPPVPQTSMSYIQCDIPYMTAYAETNQQLDSAIKELNVLGGEIMTELVNVKNISAGLHTALRIGHSLTRYILAHDPVKSDLLCFRTVLQNDSV